MIDNVSNYRMCGNRMRPLAESRPCALCGAEHRPFVHQVRAGKGTFCSRSCAAAYNSAHYMSAPNLKRGTGLKNTDRTCTICGATYRSGNRRSRFCSRPCAYAWKSTDAQTEARFWERVAKGDGDACWNWTGNIVQTSGYGTIICGGGPMGTHRYSWELHNGPLPRGGDAATQACVLHKCDNRRCVRPDHLFVGTRADNVADMIRKGRRAVTGGLCGAESPCAKLTAENVRYIRAKIAEGGITHRALAVMFGVDRTTVTAIVRGKNWSKGGD